MKHNVVALHEKERVPHPPRLSLRYTPITLEGPNPGVGYVDVFSRSATTLMLQLQRRCTCQCERNLREGIDYALEVPAVPASGRPLRSIL